MNKTEIEKRIAEIEKEEKKASYEQWAFGIMVDKQHSAKLFQEKMELMKKLKKNGE